MPTTATQPTRPTRATRPAATPTKAATTPGKAATTPGKATATPGKAATTPARARKQTPLANTPPAQPNKQTPPPTAPAGGQAKRRTSRAPATKPGQATTTNTDASPPDSAHQQLTTGRAVDRVKAALTNPAGATMSQIMGSTGLSRPTVTHALRQLQTDGLAARTQTSRPGSGRKPGLWHLTHPTTTKADTAPATSSTRTSRRRADGTPNEASPSDRRPAVTVPKPAKKTAAPAVVTTPAADPGITPDIASPDKVAARSAAPTSPDRGGTDGAVEKNPVSGTVRLASGELGPMVAEHFAAHPKAALTPGEVARVLGRSGGAVRNAMDRLTAQGVLVMTGVNPRRYTAATP